MMPTVTGESIAEIGRRFRQTAAARDAFLGGMDDARLAEKITCTSKRWGTANFSFGDMMLHVCNHGAHHRAQAINMLRHLGVAPAKPPLDYIFMKMEPAMAAAPALDGGTLRAYYAYADWARARVYAVAAKLSDEQLDRPFEIGMGCVRATLGHLRDAEQWWLVNWTRSPDHGFPAVDPRASITELSRRFDHTAAERNELLNHSTDDDLQRIVTAKPRPDVTRTFPLGVTMLQLCFHGTHHRAQEHAWLVLLEGLAGLAMGVAVFLWTRTAEALVIRVIGVWALTTGMLEVFAFLRLRRDMPSEVFVGVAGAASVLLGAILLLAPTVGTFFLIAMLGSYALVFGASMLAQGLRLRRALRDSGHGGHGPEPWPHVV